MGTLMSGLPVFWPLAGLTVAAIIVFGYVIVQSNPLAKRSRGTKILVLSVWMGLVAASMSGPLMEQRRRDTTPPPAPRREAPIQLTRVTLSPYETGKSVAVNIHYRATERIGMSSGGARLQFEPFGPQGQPGDRRSYEDRLWKDFTEWLASQRVPDLMVPIQQETYFTISGIPLTEKMIKQLRSYEAVVYFTAILRYQGGRVEACGFVGPDGGPVFLCVDHNGPVWD